MTTTQNGQAVQNHIDDGLTYRAYIRGIPRLYNEVRFAFRPVTPAQRTYVYRKVETSNDPEAETVIAAQSIVKRVQEWDIKKANGEPVALSVEDVRRLQPRLLLRLFSIVMGSEGWDEDPLGKSDQTEDLEGLDLVLEGKEQEAPGKNSSPGCGSE